MKTETTKGGGAAGRVSIHKSIDPTWPRWAVSGKVADTQWFKTLAEAEAFAGFKFQPPVPMATIPAAELAALRACREALAALESDVPWAKNAARARAALTGVREGGAK